MFAHENLRGYTCTYRYYIFILGYILWNYFKTKNWIVTIDSCQTLHFLLTVHTVN